MTLAPAPATLVLAASAAAALIAARLVTVAVIAALLLAVVLARGPRGRSRFYLAGVLGSATGVFLAWPLLAVVGSDVLWRGPTAPVLGPIDLTVEELERGALAALRLAAVGLAFAAYALLVDHDRLLASLGFARRSALAAVLATRLVPTLERDAVGLAEAVRGRGIELGGVRARARLVSPLVAGSLERALNLAEAMEARGYGRPGRTRIRGQPWTRVELLAVAAALLLVLGAALWL